MSASESAPHTMVGCTPDRFRYHSVAVQSIPGPLRQTHIAEIDEILLIA